MVAEERALSLLAAALAAALTAAVAPTFVAALLTATLVAADGRGVLLHLATARGRSVLLHLATAGRRSVLLHLAAISDFFAAFRSRYRRVAANGGRLEEHTSELQSRQYLV